MKIKYLLPAALLLITFATSAANAQTLDQNLATKLGDAAQKINTAKSLAREYQADLFDKLQQIASETSCRESNAKQLTFECRGNPPTVVEAALFKIERLGKEIDATIIAVGGKSLQQVYSPKLAALEEKLRAGNIDGTEAKPLQERVKRFFDLPSGKRIGLAEIENNYQLLAADIDAAIKLSAASASRNAFMTQYQDKLKTLQEKIEKSRLNAVTKADLQRDLSVTVAPMLRPNTKHTPAEFAKADADLNAFNTRVDETILAEGSKSFKGIATAKLDALRAKIRAANLERVDAAPLETGIAAAHRDMDLVIANVQKKQAGLTFDQFEERLARLTMEVDSTIALAANRGKAKTLMEAFTNKANALNSKIMQARLNNFFTNSFVFTLAEITVRLPENCRAGLSSKHTLPCDIATLLEGDKRLDALSSTVDTVNTTYGTKSVEIIYGTALREAAAKLNQSRVGSADKMRLSSYLMPIQDMIKQADTSPRVSPNAAQADRRVQFTPEELHNSVQAALNEIEAAIRLAGPR